VLGILGLWLTLPFSLGACSGVWGRSATAHIGQPADPFLAPYVVTPQEVVDEMLRLAGVGREDLVYDLGSGDGRIVIAAARLSGARGVGFELDPELVRRARDNAARANVSHLVEFRQQDVMTVDLSPASVVTAYLSREANLKLRPRILAQMRPGTRVVSHEFDMGDWPPDAIHRVRDHSGGLRMLYLWRIRSGGPGGRRAGIGGRACGLPGPRPGRSAASAGHTHT
jgi:SAM-dependent methyltransferase